MTVTEAVKLTAKSESWLRRHCCAWCGQTALLALTGGCGAIYERCDPIERGTRLASDKDEGR
jgi:hypothetical protein